MSKEVREGRDPATGHDVSVHTTLLSNEVWLAQHNRTQIKKDNPAFAALLDAVVKLEPEPTAAQTPTVEPANQKEALREALRGEGRKAKQVASASHVLSNLEREQQASWLERAKLGKQVAERRKLEAKVQALIDEGNANFVWSAVAAGEELRQQILPASAGEELWPAPPSHVWLDRDRYHAVLALGPKKGTQQEIKLADEQGVETTRAVAANGLFPLRRKAGAWRTTSLGQIAEATTQNDKPLWLVYSPATGAYRVCAPNEIKADTRGYTDDRFELFERELLQQRLQLSEPDKQKLNALLFACSHAIERQALLQTFCIAATASEGLQHGKLLSQVLSALRVGLGAPAHAWLGVGALASATRLPLDAYTLMWGHSNPMHALLLLCGGHAMVKAACEAAAQTTNERLLNRELADRVARHTVRFIELRGTEAQLLPRFELQVASQWTEGVLVSGNKGTLVVLDRTTTKSGVEYRGVSELGYASLEGTPKSVLLRLSAVSEETAEARDKLEKALRHALLQRPKEGVLVGFVEPGAARVSSGVSIEQADLWIAEQVEVRGNAVSYKLKSYADGKLWNPTLAELVAGLSNGKQLQFVELFRAKAKAR